MNIIIRSEQEKDYSQIAEIHAMAFDYSYGMGEVLLVDALRHKESFDKELSLVAELDGRIVGHVLFSPLSIIVNSTLQNAVNLAPIGIHPSFQKQGIGSLLIEEGHKRCVEKGFDFSILLGDPCYYSRFGYETGMFGSVATVIERKNIQTSSADIKLRRVASEDISMLMAWWEMIYVDVDLAIKPQSSILDWISTSTSITTAIVEKNGEPIGYIRYHTTAPEKITHFLSRDQKAATTIIEFLHSKMTDDNNQLVLPLHPDSKATKALIEYPFKKASKAWDAGMIKIFNTNNQDIVTYCRTVKNDKEKIGLIIWPVEFDNC